MYRWDDLGKPCLINKICVSVSLRHPETDEKWPVAMRLECLTVSAMSQSELNDVSCCKYDSCILCLTRLDFSLAARRRGRSAAKPLWHYRSLISICYIERWPRPTLLGGGSGLDPVQRNNDSYYRSILNAIPLPIFVVDEDVLVHSLNAFAAKMFGLSEASALRRRPGEVLQCLHAADVPEGCGRGPSCRSCVVRNSVGETCRGQAVTRKRMKAVLLRDGIRKELDLLITASPMPGDQALALLILEDTSELTRLRNIVPICAHCKKVRNDRQYWQNVDSYFHLYMGVDFSHGLCPDCLEALYPAFGDA